MIQDLTHAWRTLARNPMFAAVAVVTLGVGIGLNTALFSIINVMLFKPLAVERGEELVWLSSASTKPNGPQGNLTYPDVVDLGALDVLRGATAFGFFQANLAADGVALRLDAQAVMGNFFEVIGVSPRGGGCWRHRPAAASERSRGDQLRIWQRLFGGRDDAIGRCGADQRPRFHRRRRGPARLPGRGRHGARRPLDSTDARQ